MRRDAAQAYFKLPNYGVNVRISDFDFVWAEACALPWRCCVTAAQALEFQNTKVLRLAESKCAKSLDPRLIDGLCFNISAASPTSGRAPPVSA